MPALPKERKTLNAVLEPMMMSESRAAKVKVKRTALRGRPSGATRAKKVWKGMPGIMTD